MSTKAIANGSNEAERRAAKDANDVQDAVNIIATARWWPRTGWNSTPKKSKPNSKPYDGTIFN